MYKAPFFWRLTALDWSPYKPTPSPPLLVDLGTGAAVSGMRIEIKTWYSCYMTVAHRRPCNCHLLCLSYLYYDFHAFSDILRHSKWFPKFTTFMGLDFTRGGGVWGPMSLGITGTVRIPFLYCPSENQVVTGCKNCS